MEAIIEILEITETIPPPEEPGIAGADPDPVIAGSIGVHPAGIIKIPLPEIGVEELHLRRECVRDLPKTGTPE